MSVVEYPNLKCESEEVSGCYNGAIKCINENLIEFDFEKYNKTGLLNPDEKFLLRAGGHYQEPWIRDTSLNVWNCMGLFNPSVAKQSLFAVCENDQFGNLSIQNDEQDWDRIIWAIGAWNYYLSTGDVDFLKKAVNIIETALNVSENKMFNEEYNLFMGGSFFNDGITGYPIEVYEKGNNSSFVGDHKNAKKIMCLSTNCLYVAAYDIVSKSYLLLGDNALSNSFKIRSDMLKKSINCIFWNETLQRFDYIIYPDGKHNTAQEACGNLFAVLFEIALPEKCVTILKNLKREEFGLPTILPPFYGYSKEKPARHNNLIWPFINTFYIIAASHYGLTDLAENEWKSLTTMVEWSDYHFFEIYNPYDGRPDGGWQSGHHWYTACDQTWSATGYIGAILYGVFGINLHEKGISFSPCVPKMFSNSELRSLCIHNKKFSISVHGYGNKVVSLTVNNREYNKKNISWSELENENNVMIVLNNK